MNCNTRKHTYVWQMKTNDQPAHPNCPISLPCPNEEALDSWLSMEQNKVLFPTKKALFFLNQTVSIFFNQKVSIIFLFLDQNICCGYSSEVPLRGASNEYPQHMFSLRNKKIIYLISTLIKIYEVPNKDLSDCTGYS